ncbi:MAG: SDR family oxidoreductase [Acidobacteriaceae bacterium]|nr:SDR family oxidoreductase [Acidobacteriaceae bacterium]MBV9780507.1 SDR family oxidoreductase [Acidobacteriaceae bacterium]
MSGFLNGKRALVTGGSKGIGFAVARALLSEGAKVVICGRDGKAVEKALADLGKAAPSGKITGRTADVSSTDQVKELFVFADQQLGGLDILINNAGMGIFRATAELSIEEWNRVIGTNLSGAFYCSREALQRLETAGGGWIINVSSLAGKNPFAGGAAYNASKFGLNGFSEAMMLDHRNDKVRVSYIMPGSVNTRFGGNGADRRSDWKIAPEDIAEIVLDILRKPERTLISRVEVRPSRPQKY